MNHPPPPSECSICCEIAADQPWVTLTCTHTFHLGCVNAWAQKEDAAAASCPLCRSEILHWPLSRQKIVATWEQCLEAVKRGDLAFLQQVAWEHIEVNGKDQNDETMLHWAVWKGYEEVTRFLVEKGADIHIKNKCGNTALLHASIYGNLALVKYLVDLGASITVCNVYGENALFRAAAQSHTEMVEYILSQLDFMVDRQAFLNANSQSSTALTYACQKGYTSIVELLLFHPEVNVNTPHVIMGSPLFSACACGYIHIVELLLQRKDLDLNWINSRGNNAIKLASSHNHLDIVRLLLRAGAKLNKTTRKYLQRNGYSTTFLELRERLPVRNIFDAKGCAKN